MICKICGHQGLETFKHTRFDMTFHKCPYCETIFKDDQLKLNLADEKKVYDLHENSIDNEGYVNFLKNFIDQGVYPFIQNGELLDFGSGPEPVLQQILIRDYGFKVAIYDYFYEKNEKVFDRLYDGITSTEVFEHLWNPIETLEKLKKILKPNGILSVMTLFYPKDPKAFDEWFYIRDPSHVTFFQPRTFEVMGEILGFKVIDTNNYRVITLKKTVE